MAPAKPVDIAKNFKLEGERWTYRDGDFEMNGILLKPQGKGPFPAVLISHGLGGSAESFGMNKAREMVQWGYVCIAPNYTHNARSAGPMVKGGAKVYTTKRLLKRTITKRVPTYEWVIENLCGRCRANLTSSEVRHDCDAPPSPSATDVRRPNATMRPLQSVDVRAGEFKR